MKLKDKLKKTGRNSKIAFIVAILTLIYLLMNIVKGVYFWTEYGSVELSRDIHFLMRWIIETTAVFPLNIVWEKIPGIPLGERDNISFYKVIIPPAVIFTICGLFIIDHRSTKKEYDELRAELRKEKNLRDMRKEDGTETVSDRATIDISINNNPNSGPSWHDTWWGRIAIGLAVVLIATAIGLK